MPNTFNNMLDAFTNMLYSFANMLAVFRKGWLGAHRLSVAANLFGHSKHICKSVEHIGKSVKHIGKCVKHIWHVSQLSSFDGNSNIKSYMGLRISQAKKRDEVADAMLKCLNERENWLLYIIFVSLTSLSKGMIFQFVLCSRSNETILWLLRTIEMRSLLQAMKRS